jgi:AraC family transcriptional regulator
VEYSVTKKELAPQPVLVMRRIIKPDGIAGALAEMFPRVMEYAQRNGIAPAGPLFSRYLAMGRDEWTIEAGIPIAGHAAAAGEIMAETLPGGPAATTVHWGPYDKLRDAHVAVNEWISAEGFAPCGAPWESYLTDPGQHPDPKDWKTEVYIPIRA